MGESEQHDEQPSRTGLRDRLARIPRVPLCFLGLGVYRAWIEIAFVGSFVAYPTQAIAGHDAFDLVMILALFVMAALSRRLTPLVDRRFARPLSAALLIVATLGGYLSVWHPGLAGLLAWPCAVAGGVGIAVMILLWSELYGCLSPVRICLYYAASLACGAVIIYVYRGFQMPWLPVMTCALPVVSLLCLRQCYRTLPARQPTRSGAAFAFPWKPIAVVAIYSLAFGLQEAVSYTQYGPHSSPGMLVCALVVIAGVALLGGRIEFEVIYTVWLPFLSAAFLVLPSLGLFGEWWTGICSNLGYAAGEIYVMTMIGSIVYHYGVSAVWLFGIERGVRALAMLAGRVLEGVALGAGVPTAPFVVVAVLVATFLVYGERRLSSTWGVHMRGAAEEVAADGEALRRAALTKRCAELGRQHGLSQREEEVLLLLAERKAPREIERELLIANGTVKAHVGHIYQKLDVHSRDELFELLGPVARD